MTDQTQAQVVPETQGAPMPSADQSQTQVQTSPQGDSQQGLPDGVSERTAKEFEKLQSQLREERARREKAESAFTAFKPEPQITPVYDPNTGLLNEQVLTDMQQRSLNAEQRAQRAEQAVVQYQEQQEKRDLFANYPQLNPESKDYDAQLDKVTAGIWYASQVSPQRFGNKQLSTKEAADEAAKILSVGVQHARDEGAQQALEQLTPKEQAALAAQGTPTRRSEVNTNHQDLVTLSRKGGKAGEAALVERMRRMRG